MYRVANKLTGPGRAAPADDDKAGEQRKPNYAAGAGAALGSAWQTFKIDDAGLIPVKRHKFPDAHPRPVIRSAPSACSRLSTVKVWQWIVHLTLPFRKFISFIDDDKEKARSWRWLRFLFPHLQLIAYLSRVNGTKSAISWLSALCYRLEGENEESGHSESKLL
jgi:hypothetical protein